MSTFLEKNKKKGALAALLLFIRTRKTVTALLLLVALASFLFVSPSHLILSLPGGARVAAGVAWMAGKVGVDTSKWGLAGGKRDYADLLAAFRAAKEGGGKAGWAAFMRGGDAARRAGGGAGSLGFVKGDAKDLEGAGGSEGKLPKPGSIAGVLNPDDAKNTADGEGVALSDEDITGEREGLVKSAFTGGFGSGGGLSGGSFASAGFFGGKGAATGTLGDIVKGALEGISPSAGKGVAIKGGTVGRLSRARASAINARIGRGMVRTSAISGQRAFVQLAAGRGRAAISVAPNCTPGSGCPGEFAATNTGAVYDGNPISGDNTGILTTNGEIPPAVPLDDEGPESFDPTQLIECQERAMACQTAKQPDHKRIGELQTQLNALFGRMPVACANPCLCAPCTNIERLISQICTGELRSVIGRIQTPCALPSYCAALGVEPPPGVPLSAGLTNMCESDMGSCGCGLDVFNPSDFICNLSCLL